MIYLWELPDTEGAKEGTVIEYKSREWVLTYKGWTWLREPEDHSTTTEQERKSGPVSW